MARKSLLDYENETENKNNESKKRRGLGDYDLPSQDNSFAKDNLTNTYKDKIASFKDKGLGIIKPEHPELELTPEEQQRNDNYLLQQYINSRSEVDDAKDKVDEANEKNQSAAKKNLFAGIGNMFKYMGSAVAGTGQMDKNVVEANLKGQEETSKEYEEAKKEHSDTRKELTQAKQELAKVDETTWNRLFNEYQRSFDYSSKSKDYSNVVNNSTDTADNLYRMLANGKTLQFFDTGEQTVALKGKANATQYYDYLEDDEKEKFTYLYNMFGKDVANNYLDTLSGDVLKKVKQSRYETAQDLTGTATSATLSSVGSIVAMPVRAIAGLIKTSADLVNEIWGEGATPDASYNLITNMVQDVRKLTAEEYASKWFSGGQFGDPNGTGFEQWVYNLGINGSWLYNTLLSMGDSSVAMAASFGLLAAIAPAGVSAEFAQSFISNMTSLLISSDATASAINEAFENGYTGVEALSLGIASGMTEFLTEKYSIEAFLSDGGIAKTLIKSFVAEGTEEAVSEILGMYTEYVVDQVSGTDLSEIKRNAYEYIKSGRFNNLDDAMEQAFIDKTAGVVSAALAGSLSGLGMGGTSVGANVINEARKGSTIRKSGNTDTVISKAQEAGVDANQISSKNNYLLGQTATSTMEKLEENYKADINDYINATTKEDKEAKLENIKKTYTDFKEIERIATKGKAVDLTINQNKDFMLSTKRVVDKSTFGEAGQHFYNDNYTDAQNKAYANMYDFGSSNYNIDTDHKYYKAMAEKITNVFGGELSQSDLATAFKAGQMDARQVVYKSNVVNGGGNVTVHSGNYSQSAIDNMVKLASDLKFDWIVGADMKNTENGSYGRGILKTSSNNEGEQFVNAHEITHRLSELAPEEYAQYRAYVMDYVLSKNSEAVNNYIEAAKKQGYTLNRAQAVDELCADFTQNMLNNPSEYDKICKKNLPLAKRILEAIKDFINYIKEKLGISHPTTNRYTNIYNALRETYDAAVENANNLELLNEHNKEILDNDAKEFDVFYDFSAEKNSYKLEEIHKDLLSEGYTKDSVVDFETLVTRLDAAVKTWESLSEEVKSAFLKEWNAKSGKDNVFTIFKSQSGYKFNAELSTMCKKGVPLFEAIDTIVKEAAMQQLNTDTIGKAEKQVLYDILKEKGFEIPCAICYVEQARQREGVIINKFLHSSGSKLGWNNAVQKISKRMAQLGTPFEAQSLSREIAGGGYTINKIDMDEQTLANYYRAIGELLEQQTANTDKAIKLKNYTFSEINAATKGSLPSNSKVLKVLANDLNAFFTIEDDLLYSSATTINLAKYHPDLYSLFNSQGGVSTYKTKQGTSVYWGDILKKKWAGKTLRKNGGLRNQSNSDFMMYTFLDQVQLYVDMTAKGYYMHAYTKVLAELKLFGLSNAKINASLIPAVTLYYTDGTSSKYVNPNKEIDIEETQKHAGLDADGNPIYDDFEGINHAEAFALLEDPKYSKSIGGICIGYSDEHVSKLLDDKRVQLIIGFHDKTNDPSKRYKGAKYAYNYNGHNEATNAEGKTVHVGFNQFVDKAEQMFGYNIKTETHSVESVTYEDKTYKFDDVPKLATQLYLDYCEQNDLKPAYSNCSIDFSKHQNYYKLLADFSLYDSQGHYAPQRKINFRLPETVPYLDSNGNRATKNTKDFIRDELNGEVKVRDSIADALADKSEDGIIAKFVKGVNELHQGEVKPTYDDDGNVISLDKSFDLTNNDIKHSVKDLNEVLSNENFEQLYNEISGKGWETNDNIWETKSGLSTNSNSGRIRENNSIIRTFKESNYTRARYETDDGKQYEFKIINNNDVDKSGIQDLIDAKRTLEEHGLKVMFYMNSLCEFNSNIPTFGGLFSDASVIMLSLFNSRCSVYQTACHELGHYILNKYQLSNKLAERLNLTQYEKSQILKTYSESYGNDLNNCVNEAVCDVFGGIKALSNEDFKSLSDKLISLIKQQHRGTKYSIKNVDKDIAALASQRETQIEALKNEFRKSKYYADAKSVDKFVNSLMKGYTGKLTKAQITTRVQSIYRAIQEFNTASGETVNTKFEILENKMTQFASDIVKDELDMTDKASKYFKDLHDTISKRKVKVSNEFFRDYKDSEYKVSRAFKLVTGDGITVDDFYNELIKKFPDTFRDDLKNELAKIEAIQRAYVLAESAAKMSFSDEYVDAVDSRANELYTQIVALKHAETTVADDYDAVIQKLKLESKVKLDSLRAEKNDRYEELVKYNAEQREKRHANNLRRNSTQSIQKLFDRLRKAKKTMNAKNASQFENLEKEFYTLASSISDAKIQKLEDLKTFSETFDLSEKAQRTLNALNQKTFSEMTQQELNDLEDALRNLVKEVEEGEKALIDDDSPIDIDTNMTFSDMALIDNNNISTSKNAFTKKYKVLNDIDDVITKKIGFNVSNFKTFIRRVTGYNEDSYLAKFADAIQTGERVAENYMVRANERFEKYTLDKEFMNSLLGKKSKVYDIQLYGEDGLSTVDVKLTRDVLISLWCHMQSDSNLQGLITGGFIVPDLTEYQKGNKQKAFAEKGAHVSLIGNNAQVYNVMKTLYQTILKGDSDFESWDAEDQGNLRYLRHRINNKIESEIQRDEDGRITVGSQTNSRLRELMQEGKFYALVTETRKALLPTIEKILGDDERNLAFARDIMKYYSEQSKPELNVVSRKLLGYDRFTSDNYFPKTNDDVYRKYEVEANTDNATAVDNQGFTHERLEVTTSPVVLKGVVDVFKQSVDEHAKYVGLAIPVRNFTKLYNSKGFTFAGGTRRQTDSIKQTLNHTWGQESNEYIKKFLRQLQNGVKVNSSKLLEKIRSNSVAAAIAIGLPVSAKQIPSSIMAIPELSAKAVGDAFRTKDCGITLSEVNKYTSIYRARQMGYSHPEIADYMSDKVRLPKVVNIVSGADLWTVRRLLRASAFYVQETTNLKPGTEEFAKEVAKTWERVIIKTQPCYDMSVRAQFVRSEDSFVRQYTTFKTQLMQNANMLIDSIGEYQTMKYKNKYNLVDDETFKKSKHKLGAVLGVIGLNAAIMAAINKIANFARGKKDKSNEDAIADFVLDLISSLTGMVPFGSEVQDALAYITGIGSNSYYGSTIQGITESTLSSVIRLSANLFRSFDDDFESVLRASADFSAKMVDLFNGFPASRLLKYIKAILSWTGIE